MSETEEQHDAGQDWGVDWRKWGTWFAFGIVTVHLSIIASGSVVISGVFVEQGLSYEGPSTIFLIGMTALPLWGASMLCILATTLSAVPNGMKAYMSLGRKIKGEHLIFYVWLVLFMAFNMTLIDSIWRALSFQSSTIGHG